MICTNCGTENRPGAKFCMECGTPFAAACPNCGTVNPQGAKFCSECATPLQAGARPGAVAGSPAGAGAPAPTPAGSAAPAAPGSGSGGVDGPVAERRLVSILFADLVGFTTFSEGRDSEEVRELLTRYFDEASAIVGRYGGTVEKFIGDAVMAVWGAPVAREDDAERAVRAAIELVDAVPALGPGIQARAGVLTGEAAVTIGAVNQGMVAGDLVNTASRLQSAANPGVVLVGETTQRAAAGAIVFEEAGEHVVKGKAAPVAAWRAVRVVAQLGGVGRSDTLEAPFVGRDEELRLVKDLFHATGRERKSRLISVIGPAGIGKSRLAWEFLKYIDGLVDNVWWHAGRSPAYGEGITFWALGEMVRRRAGLAETDDEATTRAGIAATVRRHVPDEAEARWVEAALLQLLGVGSGGSPLASDQLFAAWRTLFERLATTSPVVMVFEDLHHADTGLLDFIDHLMEWSRSSPITVVTLSRPELLERRPDWGAAKRAFTSIHLEPLAPADMEKLLAGLVPGLPKAAVDRIVTRADGIPLYAVETVRMLLAQGRLVLDGDTYRPTGDLDDLAVPETLTALIAARLDGLEPADRALIEDAAVLGQSFTVAGLSAVSGQDPPALDGRLRTLVRRELLVQDVDPRSPERGQYAFVQALIREVAYNTLSRKDRKTRHLAAARHFESLATDELAGGLAGHYLAAQRLAADEAEANALAAQARIALRGAAERASALGSFEQARTFLEQALEVTTDPADRGELHERALLASMQILEVEPVLRHGAAIEEEYRKTGDREKIATAIAYHAQTIAGARNDPAAARAMLEAAWEEFGDLEQTQAGVYLMAALARASTGLADSARAVYWADRLLPVAERLGDLESIVRGIQRRGSALALAGRPREGMMLMRGTHELAKAHDLREVELGCRILLTFYEQWGSPAAGLALGREGLEIARRIGSQGYGFQMVGNAAISALRVGDWDWVAETLDEWLEIATDPFLQIELRLDRALLHALRGLDPTDDIESAAREMAATTDPQFQSYELFARAVASLTSGDLAAAIRLSEEAAERTDYFNPLAMPVAARAALWAGDAATARRLFEAPALAPFSGAVLDADRLRIRAGLAALEGRAPEALNGFLEAMRAYAAIGLPFEEAACAVDLAVALPGIERDSPPAADAIARARGTLGQIGAAPFLARLEEALARGASGSRSTPDDRDTALDTRTAASA